jgi:ketosteroid isomerase-like protein
MKKQRKYFFISFLISIIFIACNFQNNTIAKASTDEILNADTEFSTMSRQLGMKKAFLQYMDDEAILLRPDHKPVIGADAIDFISILDDSTYTLTWRPSGAQIASSGDLGFTFGIYTLLLPDTTLTGTYVNVWKKRSSGEWKFVLNSNNPGTVSPEP